MIQFTMWLLIGLIALLSFALVGAIFKPFWFFEFEIISQLSGFSNKSDVLKYLGIGIGGLVLILQAVIANRRAKALEKAAKAQARATEEQAKTNQLTERGLRQERLKIAIEHLGNDSESIRLGGVYELFHLAQDTKSLRQTVLDILCADIRRTTRAGAYQEKHLSRPSEEIQNLLSLLFVQKHGIFTGLHINLYGSWLKGANLNDANLQRANLADAYLKEAWLERACLQEANLERVHMQGANLSYAQLQGANIQGGELTVARLRRACSQGAVFCWTKMYGAELFETKIQGAKFGWTFLQGADLDKANLQGAVGHDWTHSTPFVDRIRGSIGKETTLLKKVVDGGIEDACMEQLIDELLSQEKKNDLRVKLGPYTDNPDQKRRRLPENHRAIIGSYTEEEAEQWIAEHEAAMMTRDGSSSSLSGE